jgi:hypothetical protein
MRETSVPAAGVGLIVLAWAGVPWPGPAFAQAADTAADSPTILLTATIDLQQPPFFGAVEGVSAEGELRIGPYEGKPGQQVPTNGPLGEGLYLGVVRNWLKNWSDAHLVRVEVREVLGDGRVVARVGRDLDATISVGKLILLVRPPQATTAQMQALPDLVTLEQGPAPKAAAEKPAAETEAGVAATPRADRAQRNLAAIAKAIIAYEDAYRSFPPALLIGPDGRAWHSWRVLILPFFDDPAVQAIRDRYSFEEPWDGPTNKQLLNMMPDVYADEPDGKPADAFTRYAAVTGEGMMFSSDGVVFDPTVKPRRLGRGVLMNDFRDAAASTLMVGTLASDARIPWTKPEDVVVGDEPSQLGAKGFFGTPYESVRGLDKAQGAYGLFVRADGGLAAVSQTIDPRAFRALTTIAGREGVDLAKTPGAFLAPAAGQEGASAPPPAARGRQLKVVMFQDDGATKARLAE